jgi:hypothetical protein
VPASDSHRNRGLVDAGEEGEIAGSESDPIKRIIMNAVNSQNAVFSESRNCMISFIRSPE